MSLLTTIADELAGRVAEKLGLDVAEAKAAAPQPAYIERAEPSAAPQGKSGATSSPALSMDKPADSIKGRKIAVLAGPGADADKLLSLKAALNSAGAVVLCAAETKSATGAAA